MFATAMRRAIVIAVVKRKYKLFLLKKNVVKFIDCFWSMFSFCSYCYVKSIAVRLSYELIKVSVVSKLLNVFCLNSQLC